MKVEGIAEEEERQDENVESVDEQIDTTMEEFETQEQVMARKLVELTVSSRRVTPIGQRRKTALELIDTLRNHIISSSRRLLTDDEADELISQVLLDYSFD